MTIGHRLRFWLASKGWTIRHLSERSGVPYRTLQNYLADDRQPGATQLAGLSEAGVNVNWLLTGKVRAEDACPEIAENGSPKSDQPVHHLDIDLDLREALFSKSIEVVDNFNRDKISAEGRPMGVIGSIRLLTMIQASAVKLSKLMDENLAELRSMGVGTATLVNLIFSTLSERMDQLATKANAGEDDAGIRAAMDMLWKLDLPAAT